MIKNTLNGSWNLEIIGKDSGLLPEGKIEAKVPGSVYGALLKEKLIPDPFYRDNELKVLPLMDNDFAFSRSFEADKELLFSDEVILRFEGIDTLADIYLNGELLGCAYNMHRIWEYDVKEYLKEGANELKVVLHSPTKYIKEENEKVYTGGAHECMEGFPHLRKCHCMFGWDWGPRLPDAGIFREVSLLGLKEGRFESVYVMQKHEEGKVTLDFDVVVELLEDTADANVKITVTSPEGEVYCAADQKDEAGEEDYRIVIENVVSKLKEILDI